MSAASLSVEGYVDELRARRLAAVIGVQCATAGVHKVDEFLRASEAGVDLPPLACFIDDDHDDRAEAFDMAWIRPGDGPDLVPVETLRAQRALLLEVLAVAVDRWRDGFAEHGRVTPEMSELLERIDRLDDRIRDLTYGIARVLETEAA